MAKWIGLNPRLAATGLKSGLDLSFANVSLSEAQLFQVQARNDVEAASWLDQAARQSHRTAQWYLGNLFYEGRGVARDRSQTLARGHTARNVLALRHGEHPGAPPAGRRGKLDCYRRGKRATAERGFLPLTPLFPPRR